MDYPTDLKRNNNGRKEQTKVQLFKTVPFERSFSNVLKFKNYEEQEEFFNGVHVSKHSEYSGYQIIDETSGTITIPARFNIFDFSHVSYMRFTDPDSGKWIYCFVDGIDYINEGTAEVRYEIDVWQTFHIDILSSNAKYEGTLERSTNNAKYLNNLHDTSFGNPYSKGILRVLPTGMGRIHWLVVVTKTEFSLGNIPKSEYGAFIGYSRQFRYFVFPVYPGSSETVPYSIGGQEVPKMQVQEIMKILAGDTKASKDGSDNVVNNIVNIYFTRNCGIAYDIVKTSDGNGVEKIVINTDNIKYKLHYNGAAGSGGGSNPGGGVSAPQGKYKYDANNLESRIRAITAIIRDSVPGATAVGIAGIIGCFGGESNCNPFRYEADYTNGNQYSKADSGGVTAENLFGSWGAFAAKYSIGLDEGAYLAGGQHWIGLGLGQWTGPRSKAMYDWAKSKGLSIWDLNAQIGFALSGESDSGTFVAAAKFNGSVEGSVRNFLTNWERGGYMNPGTRIQFGQTYLNVIDSELKNPTIKGA